MRTGCGLMLACLFLVGFTTGCAPKELSPAELETAAVGTWRDEKGFPLELRADKTLTTPVVTEEGSQDRSGTWSLNAEKREITLNVDKSEPINGVYAEAVTWTAYISKDGTALKLYNMAPSVIDYAKEELGKDPGAVLRKD